LLTTCIGLTNTHSVGVVRDALIAAAVRTLPPGETRWYLPVVGETYDGDLNDINGMHVRAEHVDAALESAAGGPVAEGGVGSGTGRTGGAGEHASGDLTLAFATGNRGLRPLADHGANGAAPVPLAALPADRMDGLFDAVIESTEEAIVNALVAGRTTTGRDGNT